MFGLVAFDFESVPIERLREDNFRELPKRGCVFRVFDRNDNLILLEKTHNLAARLERFYSESPQPGAIDLREISDRVEFCTTDSPFESLYLLYLERRSRFPSSYRRMKTFPLFHLLEIDPRHRFPRIDTARDTKAGIRYFGPFRSRAQAEQVKTTAERAFRIRPCEYDIRGDDPYPDCLYFQMETCSRPCNGDIDRPTYAQDVASAVDLIQGNDEASLAPLLARIQTLAGETRFEEAEQLRILFDRARKGRQEAQYQIFEVGRFDFAVLMNARSRRSRKVAWIRSGQILRIEEHPVDGIENSLASSITREDIARPLERNLTDFVYDEFCLSVSFLLRPLRSVTFFPLEDPELAAEAIARHVQATVKQKKKTGKTRTDEGSGHTEISDPTPGANPS
jgi:excinuclease UvrABC nuclease subunit